jgi:hypothetical protein
VTVSIELFEPPEPNITLGGATEALGPAGNTALLRLIVPMKPFMLEKATVDLALAP